MHNGIVLTSSNERSKLGVILSPGSRTLLKNTEIVSLPEELFLSSKSALADLEGEVKGLRGLAGTDDITPTSWLALHLLYERSKGESSSFAPLLASIPSPVELDTATLWSPEQRQWLKGSPVLDRIVEIADGVRREWEQVGRGVASELFRDPGTDCSLDLYRWAIAVIDARSSSVASGKELVLAPVAAQLAPALEPTARVDASSTGMFFSSKRTIRVVLERDVSPGEGVTISGGAPARNADLLVERGVNLSDSSANAVEMRFSLTAMDPFYEDKVDILEQYGNDMGISDGAASFELEDVREGKVWEPPEWLDVYLRLLCLGGKDAFLLEGVFRGEIWDHLSLPLSAENEKAVCDTVIGACEDALEGYALAEDASYEGDAEDIVEAARWALAKALVDAERSILNCAVEVYKRRASSLDAVEYYAERRLKALDLLRPVDESEIVDSESGSRVGRAFDENYY